MSIERMINDYHDPDRAGLNEEREDNTILEAAFDDGPWMVYRAIYNASSCGMTIGFKVRYWETIEPDGFNDYPSDVERNEWVYCDGLRRLGTWESMREQGILVDAISVSSIVEGIDETTDTIELDCSPDALAENAEEDEQERLERTLLRLFYAACSEIEQQADTLWHQTHGCETCAAHWKSLGGETGECGPMEGCDGATVVWTDCPDCDGDGIAF